MLRRLLLLLLPAWSVASGQSSAQFIVWGDNAMRLGDHFGASRFYSEALAQDPGVMALQWKYAEACRLSNQYPEAAETYTKIVRKDIGGRKHPEALRWLGEMQLCNGAYDDAQATWLKVKQQAKDSTSFNGRRARNALTGITLAKASMQHPDKEVVIEHPPMPLNSYDSDLAARPGPDSALYFTALRGDVNDEGEVLDTANYRIALYRAAMKGTGFDAPQALIDPGLQRANPAWSADGTRFFFTGVKEDGARSLYACTFANGVLSPAVPLGGAVAAGNASQPAYATIDGEELLFFTSDRPGGRGSMDIWVGQLIGNEVVNVHEVGTPINTPGNECCPFFDKGRQKLYFSSDFLPGFGGYDNFMSEHMPNGWSAPENFGYPLNGPANDLYPTFDASTMSGWFTSNRAGSFAKKGETCCNDLYRYSHAQAGPWVARTAEPLPEDTSGLARLPADDAALDHLTALREQLPIRLYFHNDEPGPRSWDTTTTLTYAQTYAAYKALVPEYRKAWSGSTNGTAAINGFFRDSVDQGFTRLDRFITLLEQALDEGQHMEVQVRGFASPLAKDGYNHNLSLRRIQSLVNQLRSARGGRLIPYLDGTAANGGRLIIRRSPFGEGASAPGVSDVLSDLRNSVYSVDASRERRIEIEQVVPIPGRTRGDAKRNTVPGSDPITNVYNVLDNTITQDIGTLPQQVERQAVFLVRNTTDAPMRLTRARPQCDCVSLELPGTAIPPRGTQLITIHFNGRAPAGHLERAIDVDTDGEPSTLRLIVTGTITPSE
ncbi:MAG: DUF1573 domain-containing protein [Flavobacteriales bacterium]